MARSSSRLIAAGFGAFATALLAAPLARADCAADIGGMMQKRNGEITALNRINKSHGGKLDPIEACPHLRNLSALEGQVLAYMQKNKDWCSIPDDAVNQMSQSRTRSAGFATKACGFAAKLKKMQQMQAQGAAQAAQQQQQQALKLPTGPL